MIIDLASQFELIFCLLTRPKCNLRKVKKSGDSRDLKFDIQLFPSDLQLLNFDHWLWNCNSILPLHQLKLRLTRRRWSDDYSSFIENLNSFSASWLNLNANWKRCFNCSQSTLNSFFAPCTTQNASSIKSRKRCFKLSQALPTNLLPLDQP